MQDMAVINPSCRSSHCDQSATSQSQIFSPQGGPFKHGSLLSHYCFYSTSATRCCCWKKLAPSTTAAILVRAQGYGSILSTLRVLSALCSSFWLIMLLGQFRELLNSGAISTKHDCITFFFAINCELAEEAYSKTDSTAGSLWEKLSS